MVCGRSPTERSAEQLEPRLLEDASQLLGTIRFGGWKVCKDAFQLLVLAFVHSVECAVSLRDASKMNNSESSDSRISVKSGCCLIVWLL